MGEIRSAIPLGKPRLRSKHVTSRIFCDVVLAQTPVCSTRDERAYVETLSIAARMALNRFSTAARIPGCVNT